jgi:hypothetical protein
LRHEFAAEGTGKERGRKFLNVCLGFPVARFNLVGQRKQFFHSAHNFLLFGAGRQNKRQLANALAI